MTATVAVRSGTASPAAGGGDSRRRRRAGSSPWWALVFLGPMVVGLAIFYLWPIVRTLVISFTKTGPFGGSEFFGWGNYAALLESGELGIALRNTALYTAVALLGIPLAVAIAALLNTTGLLGRGVYRTLYFIPVVTMPAAIALVWRLIYNGDYGVLNEGLTLLGIQGRSWLTDPSTALIAIAVVGVWASLGTNIVIFLAGLQGIPDTLMEAAELDGAGPVRKFFSITVPLLSPSIFFVSVVSVIGALQVFDLVYMMLGRNNPALPDTRTVVYLFYQAAFLENDRGYAAAIAFVLLIFILALTLVQFRLQKRWVHYE